MVPGLGVVKALHGIHNSSQTRYMNKETISLTLSLVFSHIHPRQDIWIKETISLTLSLVFSHIHPRQDIWIKKQLV